MRAQSTLDKYKIFSGSALKLIAVIAMVADHSAYLLSGDIPLLRMSLLTLGETSITVYYLLRRIGRLAFPIFCFLISEGYLHTRNKKRYARNLLLFALISELPFNLMAGGSLFFPGKQNIYFTLLMGLLMIHIAETVPEEWKKALLLLGAAGLTLLLDADYGLKGALLVLLVYVLRSRSALRAVLAYPLLSGGLAALAAFLPISLYNGKRGFIQKPLVKYSFYLFYPLHILLLLLIRHCIRS